MDSHGDKNGWSVRKARVHARIYEGSFQVKLGFVLQLDKDGEEKHQISLNTMSVVTFHDG